MAKFKEIALMKDYFFVAASSYKLWVIPEEHSSDCCLAGFCAKEFEHYMRYVVTAPILSISKDTVITKSNIEYTLINMSKDYKDFLNAVYNDIPVVYHWRLTGSLKEGYYLLGSTKSEFVRGKVVSQNKNFVTLDDGKEYFVMWRNFYDLEFPVIFKGKYLDINYKENFENCGGFKCRPILFR